MSFVKQPFREWRTDSGQPAFRGSTFNKAIRDSVFEVYIKYMRCETAPGNVWFIYQGPQYLLDEDKDYYIGDAELAYDPNEQLLNTKTYHLHFNPVRKTLSVYTEKFNVK
nr:hypothetical protein [Candidatus Phytoplasma sacchari]KAB8122756.1 hypothetical protein F2B49_00820 [Candidatus Phytoplasma sacchari]